MIAKTHHYKTRVEEAVSSSSSLPTYYQRNLSAPIMYLLISGRLTLQWPRVSECTSGGEPTIAT